MRSLKIPLARLVVATLMMMLPPLPRRAADIAQAPNVTVRLAQLRELLASDQGAAILRPADPRRRQRDR